MKKRAKIYGAVTVITLLTVFLIAAYRFLSEPNADVQKREQIDNLYQSYKKQFPDVQDVTAREAIELNGTAKVVFIDVRGPDEQGVSSLPEAITADFYLANHEKYNDHIKIGYCTISYRSGILAQELHNRGIPIYNLRGGLLAWVHAGGKVYAGSKETNRIHVYSNEWNLAPERFEAVW